MDLWNAEMPSDAILDKDVLVIMKSLECILLMPGGFSGVGRKRHIVDKVDDGPCNSTNVQRNCTPYEAGRNMLHSFILPQLLEMESE